MRVLLVSDVHGRIEAAERLASFIHNRTAEQPELVLCAGDLTQEGTRSTAERVIDALSSIAPLIAVPGNMDSEAVVEALEARNANLHKKKREFNGFTFIGLGGAKPGFNTGEPEAKKYLSKLFEGADAAKTVLLTHSPASGTRMEVTHSGAKIGMQAIRKIIEEKQPLLHVCGHVHESAAEENIGRTLSINVGPLMHGKAAIVELPELAFERVEF